MTGKTDNTLDRYAQMLQQAGAFKGVSLGKDAWRRLRRNLTAMASLIVLILFVLLVVLVPLLPLQSPILQDPLGRRYASPDTMSRQLQVTDALGDDRLFTKAVVQFNRDVEQFRAEAEGATDQQREELESRLLNKLNIDDPFRKLWHQPSWVDVQLTHVRLALFGDYCLPSLFGTDILGRDLLARVMWGARVSLSVGIVASLVSLIIGVSYGAIAGYLGGWVDDVMMRIVDVLYSVPFIFVVILLITFLNDEQIKKTLRDEYGITEITVLFCVIGAIFWLTMARVVRGQIISLKHEQFIEAARTIGAGRGRIIFLHLVPNLLSVVIVYLTLTIPSIILFEAFLSFLGIGVNPPDVSLGMLANDGIQAITPLVIYWWLVVFPGLTLALTLFALNFLGDGLRDALDPRMKNR